MNIISTKQKKKYWVEKYQIVKGYYVIPRRLKNDPNRIQTIMIPESEVTEIVINDALDK